ncbi:MAG: CoA transferase [Pseudomonadales bacterium]
MGQEESLEGALGRLRVVDLTDERGIYGAKLLADLGADVIRPEPPGGDPLRARGPHVQTDQQGADVPADGCTSLYYAYFASGRRSLLVDPGDATSRAQFSRLLARADVILFCDRHWSSELVDIEQLSAEGTEQILINVSSFGTDGPWADYLAPDIVAGALGGAMATTGDASTPPLKAFGELNFMVSGAYAAIAALAAVHARDTQNVAQRVDVSVHECIASCLEQVFMFYWYADGALERPGQQVLPRQGPTHWSNAFTVMNGQNGSIMITPTPDFDRQLAWLIEEEAYGDLLEPQYSDPANLKLLIGRTMQLLAEWVATKDVEALFYEAQARHIPYGWVQPLARVGDNPQLLGRDWFQNQRIAGRDIRAPGAPYHLSRTPWQLKAAPDSGQHTAQILADIGWQNDHE